MPASPLSMLERLRAAFGPDAAREKLALLERLERARLKRARDVVRLHDLLCFMRAHPDDARVLARVRRMLARFARRADLRAQRDALENTGIAGTAIRFPFFWPTARWLAQRWPSSLAFDRLDRAADRAIARLLGVGRLRGGFAALDRLRPRGAGDAAHFIRLVEAMPGDDVAKEKFYDAIEPVIELLPERQTPNRTLAWHRVGAPVWQREPLDRARPDLAVELRRRPRRMRRASPREGARLLDLARSAMVARSRDLDAFAYGDPRRVRVVEDGGGLAFALNGVVPERNPAGTLLYGVLILRNGVPVGYLDLGLQGRRADVTFNVFPAFRNGDAARVFARMLAMTRHVLGARTFVVAPYQLGVGNHEAIASGAWWFYYKLGFRPRARQARALARRERALQRGDAAHRSSETVLARLAQWPLHFDLGKKR